MATLSELELQQQILEQQIEQAKAEEKRQLDAQKLRELQIAEIAKQRNSAQSFRNQARQAQSDEERKRLYQFADECEQSAAMIEQDLGITPAEKPQSEEEIKQQERQQTLRKINAFLVKAVVFLVGFFLSDYLSARLEMGFISFVTKSISQLLYFVSGAFAGVWLVAIILIQFVPDYCLSDLREDFRSLKPNWRLTLIVFLVYSLFHFLAGIVPHAI